MTTRTLPRPTTVDGFSPLDTMDGPTDADLAAVDSDWRDDAACKGQTKLFFAPKAERPQARARREHAARALCDTCPVAGSCRSWARAHHEYGYWGGESEDQRHMLGFQVMAPIGVRRHAVSSTVFLETA